MRNESSVIPIALAVAALSALFVACGSNAPPTGTPGAAGQSGAAGSAGSTGDGAGGATGNATAGAAGTAAAGTSGGGTGGATPDAGTDTGRSAPLVNPTITMLTPASLPTNNGPFTLVIDGRDFFPRSEICFDHNCWTATFISDTQVSAMIPGPALGGQPRQVEVVVDSLGPPDRSSQFVMFTITAPQ